MVHDEEEHRGAEHQGRIEDEQHPLVVQDVPVLPLDILNRPEDRPRHDEGADGVRHPQDLLPGDAGLCPLAPAGAGGSQAPVPDVEDDGGDEEEAEGDDLHGQADDDDGLARLVLALLGHHAAAEGLGEEGRDVAEDEELGEPRGPDDAAPGARGEPGDEAAEDHVDGRGDEGRRDQEEDGLDDVGYEFVRLPVGYGIADIAYCFDCVCLP